MSEPNRPGTFLRPVGPELASALAQAADSAYAPPTFFVVARYEAAEPGTTMWPFNVQPPVERYEDAELQRARLAVTDPGVEYGIFGPFGNAHVGDARQVQQATVGMLVVTPRGGAIPQGPFIIGGQQFDALFYSIQAVEKFVIPYYVQEFGPEYGVYVLNSFRDAPLALMGHLPWSEETIVATGTARGAAGPARVKAGPGPRAGFLPAVFELDPDGTPRPRALHPAAAGQP